jgi:hypothetical protein
MSTPLASVCLIIHLPGSYATYVEATPPDGFPMSMIARPQLMAALAGPPIANAATEANKDFFIKIALVRRVQ